jgi:hypothetical protein
LSEEPMSLFHLLAHTTHTGPSTQTACSHHTPPFFHLSMPLSCQDLEDLFYKFGTIKSIDLKVPLRSVAKP